MAQLKYKNMSAEYQESYWVPENDQQYSWIECDNSYLGGRDAAYAFKVMTGYWCGDDLDKKRRASKNIFKDRELAYRALIQKVIDKITFTNGDLMKMLESSAKSYIKIGNPILIKETIVDFCNHIIRERGGDFGLKVEHIISKKKGKKK